MFSSGKIFFSGSATRNDLFDKGSWAGIVPSPYKGYLDAAADRWARYVRYNSGVRAAIPGIDASFSSWDGLRLESATDYAEIVPGKTFVVTVAGGRFLLDGVVDRPVSMMDGQTYTFDLSHPSNSGHPMRFSTTQDGTHSGGSKYNTGVTVFGTPGQAGAYVRIAVAEPCSSQGSPAPGCSPDVLYYYCQNHPGMGGALSIYSQYIIAACYVYWFANLTGVGANSISFGLIINKFYENDYSAADWVNILTHELGHALGIGIFWDPFFQTYGAVPPADNFLDGSAYTGCRGAYRSVTADNRYLKIPLESTGSSGTASAHWEDDFRPSSAAGSGGLGHVGLVNELMVGYYSAGMNSIISDVSLKTLVDFGYEERNPGSNEGVPQLARGTGFLRNQGAVKMHCGLGFRTPTSIGRLERVGEVYRMALPAREDSGL